MIGQVLGPYQVLSKLGAGGMGEVYRATDSHLKRSVAIKVLPASMAADADRLARFQREAEVLAALNHPNIAQIYGLERTPDFTALRARSPRRWKPRTSRASCIATSSLPTSKSAPTAP